MTASAKPNRAALGYPSVLISHCKLSVNSWNADSICHRVRSSLAEVTALNRARGTFVSSRISMVPSRSGCFRRMMIHRHSRQPMRTGCSLMVASP
jgi:hypothetical protein